MDEDNFFDSYGWTCRDYDRAPEQCEMSTKYVKHGRTALTSCCACKNTPTKPDMSELGVSFLARWDTRRQADTCVFRCIEDSYTCSEFCDTEVSSCNFQCTEIQDNCVSTCDDEDSDTSGEGGVVDGGIVLEEYTTSIGAGTGEIWIYILIACIVLLSLICCCLLFYCRLKTRPEADVACPPDYCAEQQTMIGNPCTQEVGDCYDQDQYRQCGYVGAAPLQTQPVHS